MAFVFGNWDIGFVRNPALYDPQTKPGRDRLSDAMMSYWTNFAYTGRPGRGRSGDQPEWQAWQNGEGMPKMIVLDADDDGGVRMSGKEVTLESIKADFMHERFSSQDNLCSTYREAFAGTPAFDRNEYAKLGDGGCDSH
jgi:para-nitrobenzyl esterase